METTIRQEIPNYFGIRQPFDAPDECCMAIELYEGSLIGITGIVEYSKAFGFTDGL